MMGTPNAAPEYGRKWYDIRALGQNEAELHIYGDIGPNWYGEESVTAKALIDDLSGVSADYLTVRVNSYGGVVADGIAIYNALKRHPAAVTVEIDAVAYSIASLIAMAGDTVRMADNALLMIHAPWSGAMGNAREMRKVADTLDKYADAMNSAYLRDGGPDAATVEGWLKDGDDHYFTAAEARALGLVDETTPALDIAASLRGFDLTRYQSPAAQAAAKPPTQEQATMTTTTTQAAAPESVENDNITDIQAKAREKAMADEKARREAIRNIAKPFMAHAGMADLVDTLLDDPSMEPHKAQAKILAKLAEGTEPLAKNPTVQERLGERDKFRAGATAAIAIRAGIQAKDDTGNQFRGYTLYELARASLRLQGVNTEPMSKLDLVAAALTHTSSDFGNLLANVAEKSMLKGYDEAEETFQAWTTRGEASDFKAIKRVDLNSFPSLAEVPEGGEYQYGTIGDRGETVQLATYGKLFSITRQAIINDDLSAFTRIPQRMGRAAIRTVGNLAYAVLTSNPTMSDGTALFHADHANLLTGAAISTTSVDAMRVAMAKQKDGGSNATALNIRLANLIVPIALEGTAKVVRDSEFEVGATTKNNTVPNSVRGTFEVIADARLDASSASNWYGAASPGMHDTVEVTYLDGQDTPYLEQQNGWSVDGAEFKVRIDAAVNPLDFRTMAKNPN